MREYRSADGVRQMWYESTEIETIMQDELTKAQLLPNPAADDVAVDLEALVEQRLKLQLDQHAPLRDDILGMTEFPRGRPPRISINSDLTGALEEDETPGLRGRWRATLAHEVAHVLLHRWLFDVDDLQRGLFSAAENSANTHTLMRCLKRNVRFRSGGSDPREVQANMGMSALLMPMVVFVPVVRSERSKLDASDGPLEQGSPIARQLIVEVARRFGVSRQAAGIRLELQGVVGSPQQRTLRG